MIFSSIKFDDRTISKEERAVLCDLWKREKKRLPFSANIRMFRDKRDGLPVVSIYWYEGCARGLECCELTYTWAVVELVNHIAARVAHRARK